MDYDISDANQLDNGLFTLFHLLSETYASKKELKILEELIKLRGENAKGLI